MKPILSLLMMCWLGMATPVQADAKWVATPYAPAKVLFEFYLDDPQKIGSALYWVRSLLNPLQEAPLQLLAGRPERRRCDSRYRDRDRCEEKRG